MTPELTTAPQPSEKELKARRKEDKKRRNKLVDGLNEGLTNLQHAIWGAQDRAQQARKALGAFAGEGMDEQTAGVRDYLDQLEALLAKGADMTKEQGEPAQEVIVEHLFPGRAARWAAEDESRHQDRRTATMERYAGYTGE